jgi:hypothetical protein
VRAIEDRHTANAIFVSVFNNIVEHMRHRKDALYQRLIDLQLVRANPHVTQVRYRHKRAHSADSYHSYYERLEASSQVPTTALYGAPVPPDPDAVDVTADVDADADGDIEFDLESETAISPEARGHNPSVPRKTPAKPCVSYIWESSQEYGQQYAAFIEDLCESYEDLVAITGSGIEALCQEILSHCRPVGCADYYNIHKSMFMDHVLKDRLIKVAATPRTE